MRTDRQLSTQITADKPNFDRETVRTILTKDLGTRQISGMMIPRILSDDRWPDISFHFDVFDRVISEDESSASNTIQKQNVHQDQK